MSAEYTPGPWHTAGDQGVQIRSEKHQIAKIWTMRGNEWKANARLITAAPDLLEAAKLALQSAESWIYDQLDGTSLLESALAELEPVRAAIAKATGGQE